MSTLRHEEDVKFKTRANHNPPDKIDFRTYPYDGEDRQVFNYRSFLSNEFKLQSLDILYKFRSFPTQRRPTHASNRADNGTAKRQR